MKLESIFIKIIKTKTNYIFQDLQYVRSKSQQKFLKN